MFWQALQTQYLETLKFTEDKISNSFKVVPKVNDVCLIYDPEVSRLRWKKKIIKALIVSDDNQVRACIIQTENGETTRPVNFLYRLELEIEDYYEAHLNIQQADRAKRHQGPVRELKNKIKADAKKANLAQQDIQELINKLDAPELTEVDIQRRPRRQTAINAAELRRQMIQDNEL